MAATQFDPIFRGLGTEVGKMRVAPSGMAWKSEGGEVIAVAAGDIKDAQWLRVARGFQLRIGLKDRKRETFDGFRRDDLKKVTDLLKNHFQVTLEEVDITFKGWNWGETDFRGQNLAFMVSGKDAFELSLRNVANSNIAGRTEVSLEFSAPSGSKTKHAADEMTEIRFHVPGTVPKMKGSQAGSDADDDDEISAAQAFHDSIKETADIGQVTGDLILSFDEVLIVTPRGRYDVDMFPDYLRLRGKTYDYKILYSSISRLFLLPKDEQHVLFILGLSIPIRQGQTRYHYLVMQFTQEEEMTAELNLTDEELEKYENLEKSYDDKQTFNVVSAIFRALSKKKIIGAGKFQGRDGHACIKVNLKAVAGDLFMLEKYMFFVSKQPVLVELADIDHVSFSRTGQGSAVRTFDMRIITSSGPEHSFVSINKEELEPTERYLKEKKVRVKEVAPDADILAAVDDDDDDDDMQSVESDDDDRRSKARPSKNNDDENSSEDGASFRISKRQIPTRALPARAIQTRTVQQPPRTRVETAISLKKKKKAKDGDAPKKKKKKAADGDAEAPKKKKKKDDEMDVDDDDKPRPKPKPKSKPKGDGDAMDVDTPPRPKPKPKPKKKDDGDEDEPPKKKQKKREDD
ncbi:FACT complex subunit POB3 [Mycena kentingensis (nom. inval.)]|nr:FACT complex subunit POB3 [Mycena kentingensis (nom. inval.)]